MNQCLSSLAIIPLIDLYDRPSILFPRPSKVIDNAEENPPSQHQDCVIHVLAGGRELRWPKAEEKNKGHVQTSKRVDCNAKVSGNVPGAPSKLCFRIVDDLAGCFRGRLNATGAASVEQ